MRPVPLLGILAAILCTACDEGVSTADYDFSGTVVADGTSTPIPGIDLQFQGARTTADADGAWALSVQDANDCGTGCQLFASDPDGEENGGTFGTTVVPIFPELVEDGDGGSYLGRFEATDIQVEMIRQDGTE